MSFCLNNIVPNTVWLKKTRATTSKVRNISIAEQELQLLFKLLFILPLSSTITNNSDADKKHTLGLVRSPLYIDN